MRKPVKGEALYMLNIGNNARRGVEQVLRPVEVDSVGRKYFLVKVPGSNWDVRQFHLESWREKTDYSPGWRLYESPSQWADELEEQAIRREVSEYFDRRCHEISLEKLRAILAIIKS